MFLIQSEILHLQLRELSVAKHLLIIKDKRNWLSDKQLLALQIRKIIKEPVAKATVISMNECDIGFYTEIFLSAVVVYFQE